VTTSHTLSSTFTAVMQIKKKHTHKKPQKKNRRLKLILKKGKDV
jgi:hypothetical protein